ncbi:helix-turn-helix domain-containing protein [Metabacillus arenae]|uniref:Helix-turn-helix domain-containing protein n=1 Tax=Metabacillus arenae TaxID=2771434 RepID=A0A926NLK7_9BACI|nr:helix-turn-helix domain-containing protein [Metabacillus arenae]MBD1383636.1 helix-turn-helix domain-containing protein [Metabacillus arenae]
MAKKGQKLQNYSFEIKAEAIRLKESGFSAQQVADKLNIPSRDTVKTWWWKYQKEGQAFYLDNRGRRKEYTDQERYIRKLEMENAVLKKFQEILMKEGKS